MTAEKEKKKGQASKSFLQCLSLYFFAKKSRIFH